MGPNARSYRRLRRLRPARLRADPDEPDDFGEEVDFGELLDLSRVPDTRPPPCERLQS